MDAFYRMHLEGRDTASAAEAVLQIYKEPDLVEIVEGVRCMAQIYCFIKCSFKVDTVIL